METKNTNTAWQDGFRAGRNDRLLGFFSRYAWEGIRDDNPYENAYSSGYRAAFDDQIPHGSM